MIISPPDTELLFYSLILSYKFLYYNGSMAANQKKMYKISHRIIIIFCLNINKKYKKTPRSEKKSKSVAPKKAAAPAKKGGAAKKAVAAPAPEPEVVAAP